MARKGDGIQKRGNVWWLDCRINGTRYQVSLGKGINRKVALELAAIKRTAILRGEAAIAKTLKRYSLDDIKCAIGRYSQVRANERGRYRDLYAWTLWDIYAPWKNCLGSLDSAIISTGVMVAIPHNPRVMAVDRRSPVYRLDLGIFSRASRSHRSICFRGVRSAFSATLAT